MDVPTWDTIYNNGNYHINKKSYSHINRIRPEFFVDNFFNSDITNEKFAVVMYAIGLVLIYFGRRKRQDKYL